MGKYYLFIIFGAPLLFSACDIFDSFSVEATERKFPDTIVLAVEDYIAEVEFDLTDSTYEIVKYWTDEYGNWLYRLEEEPYKRGRLHGTKIRYNEYGDTLQLSHWEAGIQIDSMVTYYPHRPWQLKHAIHFKKNGNKFFEVSFHPNGNKRTDTIFYYRGMLDSTFINIYDSTGGKMTEQYLYLDNQLASVMVQRPLYDNLDAKVRGLKANQDSAGRPSGPYKPFVGDPDNDRADARNLNNAQNQQYQAGASDGVDDDVW